MNPMCILVCVKIADELTSISAHEWNCIALIEQSNNARAGVKIQKLQLAQQLLIGPTRFACRGWSCWLCGISMFCLLYWLQWQWWCWSLCCRFVSVDLICISGTIQIPTLWRRCCRMRRSFCLCLLRFYLLSWWWCFNFRRWLALGIFFDACRCKTIIRWIQMVVFRPCTPHFSKFNQNIQGFVVNNYFVIAKKREKRIQLKSDHTNKNGCNLLRSFLWSWFVVVVTFTASRRHNIGDGSAFSCWTFI